MSTNVLAKSRPRPLAACLSVALGLAAVGAQGRGSSDMHGATSAIDVVSGSGQALQKTHAAKHAAPASTVTTCADDGSAGSLRYEVINAPNGGTIDLSTLACSTITLGNYQVAELQVMQDSLYLQGPSDHHLTIDGGQHSRVFRHFGAGTLGLRDLIVSNGYYASGGEAKGGCIYSASNVVLTRSTVSDCTLASDSVHPPEGSGVFATGSLTLSTSVITRNTVASFGAGPADAGGAFAMGDLHAYYSTISDNIALAKYHNTYSVVGGVDALGNVAIQGTTISGNVADVAGGIGIDAGQGHTATIANSTISDNVANIRFAGIFTNVTLELDSSTVAFNTARASGSAVGAGLYATGLLSMQSSIIADNASENGPSDLGLGGLGAIAVDVDNLITSSSVPAGVFHDCPNLQPLLDNGGITLTHAPGLHSVAIDEGYNPLNLATDQRFAPRVAGMKADIGAVEWQPGETDERLFVSGFDGVCDR